MVANVEKMALIGTPSWHGLEEVMLPGSSIGEWKQAAGLGHAVIKTPVRWEMSNGLGSPTLCVSQDKFVLYRTDTGKDLSIVGPDYNVVQPGTIIDFFDDVTRQHGFTLETAGSLAGGRKVWAMAKTGNEFAIGGTDIVKQYVLLATSYDGSIATIAKHTSQRVVCQNTLNIALNNGEPAVKVNHRSVFDETQVKMDLGLMEQEWDDFGQWATRMHDAPIPKASTAAMWYAELLTERDDITMEELVEMGESNRVLKELMNVFRRARGTEATVWGLVNGVTAMVDHVRGRSADTRLNASWFGAGATLKKKAWDKAVATIAKQDGEKVAA